jgi:hypothetical protein
MLARERDRLLREFWKNVNDFAQELHAMFGDDTNPVQLGRAINLIYGDVPPIQIDNVPEEFDVIQFARRDGFKIFLRIEGGDLVLSTEPPDGQGRSTSGSEQARSQTKSYPGRVVSGNGSSYVVTIFPNGTTREGINVSATHPQIDPNEAIPAGTWGVVLKSGTEYTLFVPVWI